MTDSCGSLWSPTFLESMARRETGSRNRGIFDAILFCINY